jgi:hypothetical protein
LKKIKYGKENNMAKKIDKLLLVLGIIDLTMGAVGLTQAETLVPPAPWWMWVLLDIGCLGGGIFLVAALTGR